MNNSPAHRTRLFARTLALSLSALVLASPFAPAATPASPRAFHVQNQWNLGGEGGWGRLLLDTSSHQLFIPRSNRVLVVDTTSGKPSGEVQGTINARAVALDDTGKHGYITDVTDGTAGFLRIFDRSSLKVIASVPTAINPDAVVFEPSSKLVFVFNSRPYSVTILDSATNQTVATVSLPGRPTNALTDNAGSVFVSMPALGQIVRIDASTRKLAATWPLNPCTGQKGLAIDNAHHQLFTTCEDQKLVAVSTQTGHVTSIADAPSQVGDIDFDSRQNLVFVSDISGALAIYHRITPTKYARLQQVKTLPQTRTMVVSPSDDRAYLVTSKFGQNTASLSEELQFRPTPVPGTFSIMVIGR